MYEKIILVTRKTRLEGLIERFNTSDQAKFYIEHSGGDFAQYKLEHDTYHAARERLQRNLYGLAKLQVIERGYLPNFLFAKTDLVVTIGIDGLVVNTAKYLTGQPIIAVNPDPEHVDGILLPFTADTAKAAVALTLKGELNIKEITMAEARLNDGQHLLAFNDLFIGVKSHVSARYRISDGQRSERQSSCGLIVCSGAGSTGWISSLFNMASGMAHVFAGRSKPITHPNLPWDAEKLLYVVREPFVSKTTGADIVCGTIAREQPLILESETPEGGVIFSDGVESDFLTFNAGTIATIGLAKQKTNLVVS